MKSVPRFAPPLMFAAAMMLAACATSGSSEPMPTATGEWPHYGGDRFSRKYSPLDQINRSNVAQLEPAWSWTSADEGIKREIGIAPETFKPTPIMVGGVLYTSTSFSQVAAIDAGTGETIWVYDPESYRRGRPANTGFQHRGVEYWTDGEDERIIIATGSCQLIALNAKTGRPYEDFGDGGWVDLTQGLGKEVSLRYYGVNSPPVVCRDTIVVGSVIFDFPVLDGASPPGHVRGFDVRTGEMKWIFHTIPQEGEFGVETWEGESWKTGGAANVWTMMSADEELGYVYLPTSTPANDYYGGHRPGDNLFAESLVCLNAETGERVWHFQAVRHGVWDYDFPCAPTLVEIEVDGRKIKAVAQVSKQGFTYVFDRATGEPVWPIEQRPVPQSEVPGEKTSPTQPFPTKPPAFERQGFTEDDVIDFTPEIREETLKILAPYRFGPMFTPPAEVTDGVKGTVVLPGPAGGANWGGAAFDPETGVLYVPSMTLPLTLGVGRPDPNRSNFRYIFQGTGFIRGYEGLPVVKPPYGRITAINLNRGEILWQVPHGDGPRDHPLLKDLNLPPLGSAANGAISNGGAVLTKELLFAIQADEDPRRVTRMGATGFLRAWDKLNGELVWEHRVDLTPHGTPMTYLHEGRQYIVFSVGGLGQEGRLLAFALPSE
jgi:quinoprotein glucose dehydrogenase